MIDDNINYEYIIRYIRGVIPSQSGLIAGMEDYARIHDVPISQPETIALIEILLMLRGAKRVLEVGSAIGYSAIRMSRCCGCRVDTIEISEAMSAEAEKNIVMAQLEDKINIIKGDAKEILPTLDGGYDAIFVDAAKAQYNEFFPHCMRMLNKGGILISDNVLYKGMTATDELVLHRKRTIVKRLRKYIEMLNDDKRLKTVVLPVGDGVALSILV